MSLNYKFLLKRLMALAIICLTMIVVVSLWRSATALYVEHLLKQADSIEYIPASYLHGNRTIISEKKALENFSKGLSLSPGWRKYAGMENSIGMVVFHVKGQALVGSFSDERFYVNHGEKGEKTWCFSTPGVFYQFFPVNTKSTTWYK